MVDMKAAAIGGLLKSFPKDDSPLRLEQFFGALYARYDERFVYSAPSLSNVTRRVDWSHESPIISESRLRSAGLGYEPRLSSTP